MKEKRTSASLFGLFMTDLIGSDEEESSDEDFRVEDHSENSDLSNDDASSDEDGNDSSSSDENDSSENETKKNKASKISSSPNNKLTTTDKLAEHAKSVASITAKILSSPVCCACLGDRSDDTNEIVECDGCKITVHEGCYGISDSISVSSTVSSCSTEPWFCEPCKANVKNPDCELCPNKGGIFKETDCGKWVHLVCALYVPGVAFGEVDQLSSVTLFEMQYNKWGAKMCSLCEDDHFARTGVCIGCDAGMCKNYFHVTCAQREGLLSEAHHEEVDQADPFYAHCKAHSDKFLIKHRKKNYNALIMQMKRHEAEAEASKNEKPTEDQERIERKLKKHRIKYATNKLSRPEPWVPTQKMPRGLITSASAVKKLMKKAELMEIDTVALEFQEAQIASLTDIRKKWHIPPAFTTEFVGYYLDRSIRMREMKTNLQQQVEANKTLLNQQSILRTKYDDAIKINQDVQQRQKDLMTEIEQLHNAILIISPNKQLQNLEILGKSPPAIPANVRINATSPIPILSSTPPPQMMIPSRTMSVPTAAALKQGVGFPLNNLRKDDTGRILSTQCISNDELLNECGICKKCNDQHLLAKCDTCHLYYHLGCLNPPLTRHPKKSKLYAWQCSECDKSDDSAPENVIIPKGPRRSRIRYSKDGIIMPENSLHDSFGSDQSLALSIKSDKSFQNKVTNGSDPKIEAAVQENVVQAIEDVSKSDTFATITPIVTKIAEKREKNLKSSPLKQNKKKKTSNANELQPTPLKSEIIQNHLEISIVGENQGVQEDVNLSQSQSSLAADEKKPKRGRPPKRTLSQISNDLQKQHDFQHKELPEEEVGLVFPSKSENSLLDLSRKVECPLDQYRAFADIPNSIPYPTMPNVEFPKFVNEAEIIPVPSEIFTNGLIDQTKLTNGDGSIEYSTSGGSSGHHKHKKRKSHKRRHSHSPSSNERQSSSVKKHKRKHKHRDHEAPLNPLNAESTTARPIEEQSTSVEHPRIKIKFRAILQAGDDKKPPKFMWHVPNEKNDTNEQTIINNQTSQALIGNHNGHHIIKPAEIKKRKKSDASPKKGRLVLNLSPSKNDSTQFIATTSTPESPTSQNTTSLNKSLPLPSQICDVCNTIGSSQNLVKCDDCQKNYHFHCLIPPLKKTPKKRGYSWHCADCDPTDRENN